MPALTLHVVVQEEDLTDDALSAGRQTPCGRALPLFCGRALPLLRTCSPRARVPGQSHMQSYGNRH